MIRGGLFYIFIAYVCLALFAYFFSDNYIFPHPQASYKDSTNIIKISTPDGAVISAVYLSNKRATYTVLINHGNAEDLGYLQPFLKTFHDKGFAIFAYDYQGYGTSTGTATEKNAYQDSDAAYDYLTTQLHIPSNHIIAYGHSLGAALAIHVAVHNPVAGLIIVSPFVSAFRTVTYIPLLPFDKFNNLNKIKKVTCPILVIHGTADSVIPFWHGKKLYDAANAPKNYLWIKNADHNNIAEVGGRAYWNKIHIFSQELDPPPNSSASP